MPTAVLGPVWSASGLRPAGGRYPLRVETHVSRMVDKLVPGVITTTYHARTFTLHALVWAEAMRKKLDDQQGMELLRRCEVVLAAIAFSHEHDGSQIIRRAHGEERLEPFLRSSGVVDIATLQKRGGYSDNQRGFFGIYGGPASDLGILTGKRPTPTPRVDEAALNSSLGTILELAQRDSVTIEELKQHGELCLCKAATSADGAWLYRVLLGVGPADEATAVRDASRRDTIELLLRVLARGQAGPAEHLFREAMAFGDWLDSDPIASRLEQAQAWRGTVLRNYSVSAWRRIWSWLVDRLDEPTTPAVLADAFAEQFENQPLRAFMEELPSGVDAGALTAAEKEVKTGASSKHPPSDLAVLCLGARRLTQLDGTALAAFTGSLRADDLGPAWMAQRLERDAGMGTREFARELASDVIRRAMRISLDRMRVTEDGRGVIPSRVRERDGLLIRRSTEGFNDIGIRIESLSRLLISVGAIEQSPDRTWTILNAGGLDA